MSFDLAKLVEVAAKGPFARVVVADVKGSAPREIGAAMIVEGGARDLVSGTIGGGALEFEAVALARAALASGVDSLVQRSLGPSLGQCCGGAVRLLIEVWDTDRLANIDGVIMARPLPGRPAEMPLGARRRLAAARREGAAVAPGIVEGWFLEPVTEPRRAVWVWGAGHVGRALVGAIAPLPGISVTWADTTRERFPAEIPPGVETVLADDLARLVALAPDHAEHLVLTYSHALDLEICHRVLSRRFASLGLIGSATKKARFCTRLAALGHGEAQIARMVCPIGDPGMGKHPQAIAIGVAADLLGRSALTTTMEKRA